MVELLHMGLWLIRKYLVTTVFYTESIRAVGSQKLHVRWCTILHMCLVHCTVLSLHYEV